MDDIVVSKVGIKVGDVIISVDGIEISGFYELCSKIVMFGEGKCVKLGIYWDGKVKIVNVIFDGVVLLIVVGEEIYLVF